MSCKDPLKSFKENIPLGPWKIIPCRADHFKNFSLKKSTLFLHSEKYALRKTGNFDAPKYS